MAKITPPSINETAFDCPHCGALTTQYWFNLYADGLPDKNPHPVIPSESLKQAISKADNMPDDKKRNLFEWVDSMHSGLVFFEHVEFYWVNSPPLAACSKLGG